MSGMDQSSEDQAHDILAAEASAVPAPDPDLQHGPVVLPEDPSGVAAPHDVLAAEEFAMPAPRPGDTGSPAITRPPAARVAQLAAAAGGLVLLARRLRRR